MVKSFIILDHGGKLNLPQNLNTAVNYRDIFITLATGANVIKL